MPSFKLYYFNARGAAENSRLLLKLAGQPFDDVRYQDDWPKHKDEMPLKAMPVIEIDGEKVCQSNAIARYLAREYGFYGKTNRDALSIDECHEAVIELSQGLTKVYFSPEEGKAEAMKKYMDETFPKIMAFLEKRLTANGGGKGFFVGSAITLADVAVFNYLKMLTGILEKSGQDTSKLLAPYPNISGLVQRVASIDQVAKWLKERPVTDF